MKNKMKTKQELGKISYFLRGVRKQSGGQSGTRKSIRRVSGIQSSLPSSTKIGGGDAYRIRNIRMTQNK